MLQRQPEAREQKTLPAACTTCLLRRRTFLPLSNIYHILPYHSLPFFASQWRLPRPARSASCPAKPSPHQQPVMHEFEVSPDEERERSGETPRRRPTAFSGAAPPHSPSPSLLARPDLDADAVPKSPDDNYCASGLASLGLAFGLRARARAGPLSDMNITQHKARISSAKFV